jgi:hypothetical protein
MDADRPPMQGRPNPNGRECCWDPQGSSVMIALLQSDGWRRRCFRDGFFLRCGHRGDQRLVVLVAGVGKQARAACAASEPQSPFQEYRVARMAKLEFGDTAPDFELPVRGKETVRLSTALQKGPVVLLTYVLDFSPG